MNLLNYYLIYLFLFLFLPQHTSNNIVVRRNDHDDNKQFYKNLKSISSILYKIFLNEFQQTNKMLKLMNDCDFNNKSFKLYLSNSIRILDINKYYKIKSLSNRNRIIFEVLKKHRNTVRRRSTSRHLDTLNQLIKLNQNEKLVKIELLLINKYNLKLNVKLCHKTGALNDDRVYRRKCKTLAKSNKNYLLRLNLTNRRLNSYLVITTGSLLAYKQPIDYFLVINVYDRLKCEIERNNANNGQAHLVKRSINNDEDSVEQLQKQQCKRVMQRVNFNEIFGWNNAIIQPANYIAYKCEGVCDFKLTKYTKFSTNHSTIQSLYNWLNPNLIIKSCCVPIKYKPMYLLNYDVNNEIVMKQHENMIVDVCGCR